MSRVYTVEFENVAVAAAQDLFELTLLDDIELQVLALHLSQITQVGDTNEEQLLIQLLRGFGTTGSGGSTPTPRPLNPTDGSANFTAKANNTTLASGGFSNPLWIEAMNIRVGMRQQFVEEKGAPHGLSDGVSVEYFVVRVTDAPTTSMNLSGTLYVEEL